MTRFLLTISLLWLLPTICHTLDIPLPAALLIHGEPVGFTRSLQRQKRSEIRNGSITCKEDEYKLRTSKHCCNKCLAGFKVVTDCAKEGMKSKCAPCQEGSFRKSPSGSKSCSQCTECLSQFGQITLQPCTTINDTVCGCPAGQYKSNSERKFNCLQCTKCENGSVHIPCTATHNTVCKCFFKFFLDSTGNCRSCDECNQTEDCMDHCPKVEPTERPENQNIIPLLLSSVIGVILLAVGTVLIVKNRQKLWFCSSPLASSPLPTTDISGQKQQSTPLMEKYTATQKLEALPGHAVYVVEDAPHQNKAQNSALPLPDITLQTKTPCLKRPEVLYKIIECIPVGSWREFIRRLGVSNHVIETSEHDYRHYKEAQYAMLSFWVHNDGSSGATMDSLFRVLKEMNLGGCVERIEESL